MDDIRIISVEGISGASDYVVIDRGNGEFTSMPKSVYDEMIAAQSTPIVTEDE